jgi:hydrogenase nickel incorporation protein HypB
MNRPARAARLHHTTPGDAPHTHASAWPAAHTDGPSGNRTMVDVHEHLLAANDLHAGGIRALLAEHRVFCVNLLSSPGSGKTALLEASLLRFAQALRVAVIEGDIETSADADRLAPFGIPVVQINTGPFGGDCHLAAPLVAGAMAGLDLHNLDLLVIENVGNLVCPAEFDIGEDAKVIMLSVTEGEDKPLKYPLAFHESTLALVSKVDLLPYLDVNMDLVRENIRRANPALEVIAVSSRSGAGMEDWLAWLRAGVAEKQGS